MLDKVSVSIETRITGIVAEVLAKYGIDGPPAPGDELAALGLTSIDMVELMLGVEAEFDATIPPAEITLANFRSVAAVSAMAARLGFDG